MESIFDIGKQNTDYADLFILDNINTNTDIEIKGRKRRFTYSDADADVLYTDLINFKDSEGLGNTSKRLHKSSKNDRRNRKSRTKSSSHYDMDYSKGSNSTIESELEIQPIPTPVSISSLSTNSYHQQDQDELAIITENYSKIIEEKNQRILNLEKSIDEILHEKKFLKQLLLENFGYLRRTLNESRDP
ncbi:hypothetical protein TPHA_0O01740 [Tetrapisispora phaffii CBS 4417]|uniref:Uncharacterized protein n=1 Tax=Tetrapisispora phaffii (strain ATCC 24235 / CBS 4417 / NBRC 1672 / NRRL Y-8282 / UCD 70-5) TaxID=1071381 RepID=G8C1W3_TETPH|nr:hypothetical protein TPHA_0O01740 [Tetrapisispora phaffii CBS 4417]CCE66141.1 hypothetical protein TPHA_0O01740 [Tetrapisispora phaffii CBS 4417]